VSRYQYGSQVSATQSKPHTASTATAVHKVAIRSGARVASRGSFASGMVTARWHWLC